VGVIANLALWFGLHVLFREQAAMTLGSLQIDLPIPSSIDPVAAALALLAALALFRFRFGVFGTLALTSVCGLATVLL